MKNFRDLIVLLLTLALEVYIIYVAGRYLGYNESTINVWALSGVLGLLVTYRYYAWGRH